MTLNKPTREVRSFRATELRVAEGDGNTLTGYIAVTEQPTEMFPGFIEVLKRGCFAHTISPTADNDVVALINHDDDAPVGRLSAGTLTLVEDEKGLRFSLNLPNTTRANDLKVSVERKDVTGCSFGFVCPDSTYTEAKDGTVTRSVNVVDLIEVSVGVTFPAYPQTSMALRSLPDSMPAEFRSRFETRSEAPLKPESLQDHEDDWKLNADLLIRLAEES
ncbi:HK97 family phage prohead protease [Granulicella cerasi]|uniref:HK97 family phage prohead protease n=1 Tax=Granulicella cerasi TaxID=741063 RepID=A0ABW1Z563_9BACT|nr:HK97 family phage prohead protease [Granulicella cerasi]